MPETPLIVYVGMEGKSHGDLTEEDLARQQVTILRNWQAVKDKAKAQPLDALLMDATLLEQMTDDDKAWLREQFEDGVVTAGLGVDLDLLATALGLETLRAPGEAKVPLQESEYYIVHALILGQPSDIERMRQHNWLSRSLQGESLASIPGIQAPMTTSTGTLRGELDSPAGKDKLFQDLHTTIEGIYKMRQEYAETLATTDKENQ